MSASVEDPMIIIKRLFNSARAAERLAAAAGKEDVSKADMHDPFTTFPSADA